MEEIWMPIKGYEGVYEISNLGRVKSLSRKRWNGKGYQQLNERILKQWIGKHSQAVLKVNGEQIKYQTGRLVLETFIGLIKDRPICWHKDRNLFNNKLDNLEWINQKELTQMIKHNPPIGEDHARTKLTNAQVIEIIHKINSGIRSSIIAKEYGVNRHVIHGIKGGESWIHIGIEITNKPKKIGSLLEFEVVEIKKRINKRETLKSIAKDYSVTMWAINGIKRGWSWDHIKPYITNKPKSHFTESDVIEIIKMLNSGTEQKDIAKMYNVEPPTISYIKKGKSWPNLYHLIDEHVKNTHGNTLRFENR